MRVWSIGYRIKKPEVTGCLFRATNSGYFCILLIKRFDRNGWVTGKLRRDSFLSRLFSPVDIASIAIFRIAFGLILLWEVVRYFQNGWIREYFIDPQFHFSYYGLDWVKPLPGDSM